MNTGVVPRLWSETIEAHHAAVRDAILETTWALVAEQGLRSVTMSQIADKTGIGRATLYKYFPDIAKDVLGCLCARIYSGVPTLPLQIALGSGVCEP